MNDSPEQLELRFESLPEAECVAEQIGDVIDFGAALGEIEAARRAVAIKKILSLSEDVREG